MKAQVKISVITPTYNRAHTLHRVFESLSRQTYRNFEWIIIDDGSTDNTQEVVGEFIQNSNFLIRYYKQENKHKFLSVFRGIDLAEGEYIALLDSDDKILDHTLEILCHAVDSLPKDGKYFGVTGLSQDENGTIIGDKYPSSPFDSFIFEMRYKYKIKGDKWGLGFKKVYYDLKLDLSLYENKGFIPETVYQYQFDKNGYITRFINEPLRVYMTDKSDEAALSNSFYSVENSFGLTENYKTFINVYASRFLSYPMPYIRNFGGYVIYGIKDKRTFQKLLKDIEPILGKIFFTIIYPFVKFFIK